MGYYLVGKYFIHLFLHFLTHSLSIYTSSQHPLNPHHESSTGKIKMGTSPRQTERKISSTRRQNPTTHNHDYNRTWQDLKQKDSFCSMVHKAGVIPAMSKGKHPKTWCEEAQVRLASCDVFMGCRGPVFQGRWTVLWISSPAGVVGRKEEEAQEQARDLIFARDPSLYPTFVPLFIPILPPRLFSSKF